MNTTRKSMLNSIISLILCFTMLMGTTFAWFTGEASSEDNIIQTGKLDINMYWSENNQDWNDTQGPGAKPVFNYDKWEPGYTEVRYVKVTNDGSLAFKYRMLISPNGAVGKLAEVIDVSYDVVTDNSSFRAPDSNDKQGSLTKVGTLDDLIQSNGIVAGGVLLPENESAPGYYSGEIVVCIAFHMQQDAGNEYQDQSIGTTFDINLYATQFDYENDSFDNGYDAEATWPEIPSSGKSASVDVVPDGNGNLSAEAIIQGEDMSATVPVGVKLAEGANKLTLSISNKDQSEANITLDDGQDLRAIDVHIDGVADDNTIPIAITVDEALPKGLNIGNYTLHHVEDGATVAMTILPDGETPVHNNFIYDPATGDIVIYLATFSEVALVAEAAVWNGEIDYSWYNAEATELYIANADQLAGLSAIVGGMKTVTGRDGEGNYNYSEEAIQDSFDGKTVKLVCDVNIGDLDSENGIVFYPIGYYNTEGTYEKSGTAITSGFKTFCGTFNGDGHIISNFYQNTWEMKGDHDWYSPEEQHYRDGMGLFGRVYGGTVKNLTVKNFSCDGEIATTGSIAAYADGATFENIAIVGCNPRVYNIGNGGIVGCVGWYAKDADLKTTFRNITVDNSNKITALWGSYDVSCGGIVGQYYPTSGQSSADYPVNAGIHFENCHVSAQMDVYNDVCGNYQYYAYRYAGILMGSVRENVTIDGHVYPDMTGITAENCTVHFGTWNDYYYCELVSNGKASYTHDHKMTRLTEIQAIDGTTVTYLDGTTGTVPTSGRANYVIVDYDKGHGTENATCYHFLDGEIWTHDMGGIQTGVDENGDGQDDLKEDKQHIYREFNNLVTGYGWGVTSKGVGDMAGVTILDRVVGDSVVKFNGLVDTLKTDTPYNIGDIFEYNGECGVEVINGAITVSITNLDENGDVIAEFTPALIDWANGIISFENAGNIRITIQDYYFCTATSIDIEITENTTEGDPTASSEVHNFTDDGFTSSFYTFAGGQITNGKHGTYTYDFGSGTETLNYALKFDSEGSIVFTPTANGTITVALASEKTGRTLLLNNNEILEITKADKLYVVTADVTAGTEYTLKRGSGESGIYYVAYHPTASGDVAHTHSFKSVVTAPTCTEYGYTTYTCDCGHSYVSTEVAANGHSFVDGVCSVCGAIDPNYEHTHSYTEEITKAATCTATGEKTYTCECGYSYTEVIPMVAHTPGAAATCTAPQTCTECGAVITEALGHNYSNGVCTICGSAQVVAGNEIHNFTESGKESDFYTISGNLSTSKGTVTYEGLTLTQCLKIESSTNISFTAPKAGTLTLVFVQTTPNIKVDGVTITGSDGIITVDVEAGEHTITKKDVMDLFYMVYVPSDLHTHSYTEEITKAATCTEAGSKTLTCACGDSYTAVIAKLPHSYVETVTKAATCTAEGELTLICSGCEDTMVEIIPMTEHNWISGSCTTGKTCADCGATEAASGHSWVDATCTAPKTCSVCGATEGEALGHSWIAATCTSPKRCSVCGVSEGSIASHTPGAEATCTTAQTCTVCGTMLAVALGHNYVNNVCTRCGAEKPSESFKTVDGWFETAYAEWTDLGEADDYNVYVSAENGNTWVKIDDGLVREYDGYWRADAVGLAEGTYRLRVAPIYGGSEDLSSAITTDTITVLAHDRSGYAHYNNTEGVGAYNDDGTLKDNAIVLHVTNENKNTVSITYNGVTVTGIGNILGSTGMDVGGGVNSKGGLPNTNQDILRLLAADDIPLVIRIIGNVKGASGTDLSSATSEIDGLTAYDSIDYGGSVGDNGFMARMSGGKNITIEGIGPDAVIDGWGIHFICQTADYAAGYGRNFEVRNITFRNVPEDCIGMEGQQDGSTLTAPVERCWIHNCSFIGPVFSTPAESDKDGGDGACDFKRGQYFTNSYCYYEGYHKTNLVGSSDSSLQYHLTYHHNYWKNCESRGPLARQADIHMYNNIFDGQSSYAMNPRANAYIFSEYNMFINCKNPVTVDSGAVKSYNDSFTSCIGDNNATIVTDKSTTVNTSNLYANFDTNSSVCYIPFGDYQIQEDHAEMKRMIMAYSGVMKQVIVGPEEVDISVIPEDRLPADAVVLDYSESLNKTYVASNGTTDNIVFNVAKFNSDSLTVGGNANGVDIVFYVDTTVNITMTEVSGTYSPVLCNEIGVAIITGSGTAENLPAGYYFIQSSGYDVGSAKFKEAKVASLAIERAINCTEHTYTQKVTAPTCTAGGYTTYTCTNCGYSYQGNQTAAVGHTPGAAATCTTPQICTVCQTVIKAALGHNNVDGVCTVCGKIDPETCPHTNTTSVVTAPTCTKSGYTTYTCTACDYTYVADQVSPIAHTPGAAATCTTSQVCTVCSSVITLALGHNFVNDICTRCSEEKPSSSFIEAAGWFETAYAEWEPIDGAEGYTAYVAVAGGSTWTKVDNLLIREYSEYWRVDVPGLAAGDYQIRVVPVVSETENISYAITTDSLSVVAHDRSGYAFVNGTSSGAYNENGTLKSGAVVVYVTEATKNTVQATIDGAVYTGISNILAASVIKNSSVPICVRFIGNITDLGSGDAFDKGDLLIDNKGNGIGLTLEGIGEDAVLNGFGIRLKNSTNVEIRNLALMNCDSNEGDNIGLQQANDHIWVHNCDFFYGHAGSDSDQAKGDGQLDTKKSQYVTHSYNHFWDGGKVNLQGNGGDTSRFVTYHHNWYDHCDSRMPRVREIDTIHVYNNFYDGASKYAIGATTGCSVFSEANYFLNTQRPMMISLQGTDALGDGTFSGEDGGMIKSFGDVMVFTNSSLSLSFIPYSENGTSFDAYVASNRDDVVPSSVVTLVGGTSYSNFDTASDFYDYTVESAENAKNTVMNSAGRMNGGDLQWTFTDADDTDYAVNTELKSALTSYQTTIVSIGGVDE